MKQRSILWQAAGFALVTFGGTILHFLYDWTGGNILVLPFSGVNESTWEHMKLLFWPLFLFAMVQRQFFNNQENYPLDNHFFPKSQTENLLCAFQGAAAIDLPTVDKRLKKLKSNEIRKY